MACTFMDCYCDENGSGKIERCHADRVEVSIECKTTVQKYNININK